MSDDPLRDILSAGVPAQKRAPAPAPQSPPPATPGPTRADRNNNPGNIKDGPFARSQPGYKGVDDGGFAIFGSPDDGRNAQVTKLNEFIGKGYNTPMKLASIWAPPSENDTTAYAKQLADSLGIGVNDPIPTGSTIKLADTQGQIEGYHGPDTLGQGYTPDPNDPLRNVLNGGNPPADGSVPPSAGGNGGNPGPGGPGSAGPGNGGNLRDPLEGRKPGGPNQSPQGTLQSAGQFAYDLVPGFDTGLDNIAGDITLLGARGLDALGVTQNAKDRVQKVIDDQQRQNDQRFYTPNGWGRSVGSFAGEMAALAPVAEIKPLQGIAESRGAGALAQGLARYGDYALQGGTAGAVMSGGQDMTKNAAIGAALGPVAGFAGEKVLGPAMGWAADKSSPHLKALADAIKSRIAPEVGDAASHDPFAPPAFLKPDGSVDWDAAAAADKAAGFSYDPATGGWTNAKTGQTAYGVPDEGAAPPGATIYKAPPQADREALAAAIGSRAAKSGIESTQQLPQHVADIHAQLVDQGVPPGEALREADIRGVGAQPTVATVKRTPEDFAALTEGAKATTPEGIALRSQIDANNAALHNYAQNIIESHGGTISPGDASEAVANSLAAASKAERDQVNAAYQKARQAEPDAQIAPDNLKALLNSDEAKQLVPGTPEHAVVQQARNALGNGQALSPDAINQISVAANRKFGADGAVNHWAGQVSQATAKDLDQLDSMGQLWRDARTAHRDWAAKYQDPQGIAKLIATDPQGNLVNADSWRKVEGGLLGGTDDKMLAQTVRQLKANGDTETLGKLKAAVVQKAYEAASGGNGDALGNATFSGRKWNAALDNFGKKRLQALFEPSEIADLAHVGRAGIHMNETIPGVGNPSGTASEILKAARQQGQGFGGLKVKGAIHLGGQIADMLFGGLHMPGASNAITAVGTNAVTKTADAVANRAAAKQLAAALQEQMSPETARAADAMRARRMADAIVRKRQSQALGAQMARSAGLEQNRRSEQ